MENKISFSLLSLMISSLSLMISSFLLTLQFSQQKSFWSFSMCFCRALSRCRKILPFCTSIIWYLSRARNLWYFQCDFCWLGAQSSWHTILVKTIYLSTHRLWLQDDSIELVAAQIVEMFCCDWHHDVTWIDGGAQPCLSLPCEDNFEWRADN